MQTSNFEINRMCISSSTFELNLKKKKIKLFVLRFQVGYCENINYKDNCLIIFFYIECVCGRITIKIVDKQHAFAWLVMIISFLRRSNNGFTSTNYHFSCLRQNYNIHSEKKNSINNAQTRVSREQVKYYNELLFFFHFMPS